MRKSTALMVAVAVVLGLLIVGAVGEDGNGMLVGGGGCCCCCCFFAAVRFFVDDGMLRETSDFFKKIAGDARKREETRYVVTRDTERGRRGLAQRRRDIDAGTWTQKKIDARSRRGS